MKSVRCPTCRRETAWEDNPQRPFCSERCRLKDFGNWAMERYRIAGEAAEPAEDAEGDEGEGGANGNGSH